MTMTRETDASYHYDVEDAIAYMLLCERGFGVGPMEFFDGAILGHQSEIDSIAAICGGKTFGHASKHWQLASNTPGVRGALIVPDDDPRKHMLAFGASELDLTAKRKLATRSLGRMVVVNADYRDQEIGYDKINPFDRIVEVRAVAIKDSGETRSICRNYFVHDRKSHRGKLDGWYAINPGTAYSEFGDFDYEAYCFGIGACAATVSRLWWRVFIRFGNHKPGVLLYTDATGVKDFFRFREIPEGKSRRDALVHWVSMHWRQNRIDPDVEHYVREHLRGTRSFDWHNLTGTIELPEPEIKQAEDAIEFRKELRRKKRDRRRRLIKWKS